MKSFKYMGKFEGESTLPVREHPENYVPFKEPEDMNKFMIVANIISIIILFIFYGALCLRAKTYFFSPIGAILSILFAVPHEFIHGIFMEGDVLMYQNLKQGSLFVLSLADHTKWRFILVSLAPNILFGFIPYIIAMINPNLTLLGTLGAFSIAMGAGDYFNVYSALTQMPKGSLTYMSGMHSYWYMPEK